ncbi:hypothetical protein L1987_01492 [Smallanthus sonchifolius]|uniref:Uncharacterized protein n=1 Tax=Smallanthus sonchifolius TaxID=185202 RepID=A0ACB9K5D7_9ASTR|nr:hypothetical protein L1987_01492 [Smallanthus sonchifolius]
MGDQINRCSSAIGVADDHQEMSHQSRKLLTEDLKVFTYDELKCATLDFGYKTCLGEWSFGKVYKGWVDEMTYSPTEHGVGLAIVIKTFQHHHSKIIKKSKLDLVLKKLSHPNLVKLIGYCFEGELLFLVDEFYYGNFEDCLRYGAISRLSIDTKDFTPKLSDYNVSMFTPQLLGGLDCDINHPMRSKLIRSFIVLPYCRKVT